MGLGTQHAHLGMFPLDGSPEFAHRVALHGSGLHLHQYALERLLLIVNEPDHAINTTIRTFFLGAVDRLGVDNRGALGSGSVLGGVRPPRASPPRRSQ